MLVLKSCCNVIDQLVCTHLVSVPVQNWDFKALESPSHSFLISFGDLGAVLLHSSLEVDAFKLSHTQLSKNLASIVYIYDFSCCKQALAVNWLCQHGLLFLQTKSIARNGLGWGEFNSHFHLLAVCRLSFCQIVVCFMSQYGESQLYSYLLNILEDCNSFSQWTRNCLPFLPVCQAKSQGALGGILSWESLRHPFAISLLLFLLVTREFCCPLDKRMPIPWAFCNPIDSYPDNTNLPHGCVKDLLMVWICRMFCGCLFRTELWGGDSERQERLGECICSFHVILTLFLRHCSKTIYCDRFFRYLGACKFHDNHCITVEFL